MPNSNDSINVWFTNEPSTVYVGNQAYTINHTRYHVRHNGQHKVYKDYIEVKNYLDNVLNTARITGGLKEMKAAPAKAKGQ